MASKQFSRSKPTEFVIIILVLVGFFWLISPAISTFQSNEKIQQNDPDSVLFARLFEQSILRGEIVKTDNYGCYPYEVITDFPPFYLSFIVNFTWIFFAIAPDTTLNPDVIAGFLPIVFAWLTTIIILATLWKTSKNQKLLIICAFFLLPGKIAAMTSGLLKLDYDFLISFLIWSWLLLCINYLHKPKNFQVFLGSLVVAIFLWSWAGAPMFFFIVVLHALLNWIKKSPTSENYLDFASSTMLAGGIPVLIHVYFSQISEFISLSKFSFFQPACIIAGGLFLRLMQIFKHFRRPRVWGMLFFFGSLLVLYFMFSHQIMQASGLLLNRDPGLKNIGELESVIKVGKETFGGIILVLVGTFGWSIFLLPHFISCKPDELNCKTWHFLRDWLTVMIFLSMYQVRFFRWAGIGFGLYSGLATLILWKKIKNLKKCRKPVFFIFFLGLFVCHLFTSFSGISQQRYLKKQQIEAFNWIYQNTPITSGYGDKTAPEYSILTHFNESNLLSYYTRRPVPVSNAFWGFKTMADIFSASYEKTAYELCKENKVKYILINTYDLFPDNTFNFWSSFKDLPKRAEYQIAYGNISEDKNFKNWFYFWLLDNLALTPKGEFDAGTRFRVIFTSSADKNTLPPYFFFERVEGAKLFLNADPGSKASISIEILMSKHNLIYKVSKEADANGTIEFVLPYATGYSGGNVQTDPFYKISYMIKDKAIKAKVLVTDQCVISGDEIDIKENVVPVEQ